MGLELLFDDGAPSLSRRNFVLAAFGGIAALWSGRLLYLQVAKADEYSRMAEASRTVSYDVPARRGTIYDRNGNVLATSIDATTVYVNPREVSDPQGVAAALADAFDGTQDDYRELVTQDSTFVYVKRKADADAAKALRSQGLSGVHFIGDTKRIYPYGSTAGQVVGFTNIDGEGVSGLELFYDDTLRGENGRMSYEIGADGTSIPDGSKVENEAVDGEDIIISIDIDMQAFVEEKLRGQVRNQGGTDGNAILLDSSNGEIIAVASTPYFNPSDTSKVEEGATSVKSITNAFEPGSVFKTVSATAILEAGTMTPDTVVYCPTSIAADEYRVSDMHDRPETDMTLRQIIQNSSNVGISRSVEDYLGFDRLYEKIKAYGMTEATGADYPGEAAGYHTASSEWSKIQAYNVTFGQGITVTPLQIARFYGALRNGGVACTPHFLIAKPQTDETPAYASARIIENIAAIPDMVSMLKTVVEEGTGVDAAIDGFSVAGKTGTAEYAVEGGGYEKYAANKDFCGFLPDSSSPLVCFVEVDHVYDDSPATPLFHDIMSFAIDRYRVVE